MFSGLTGSQIIAVLVSLILAMGIHEAMHAFTSHALGDDTAEREGRLTLNPFVHIDLLTTVLLPFVLILLHLPPIFAAKPVMFDKDNVRYGEYGVALIGLAGPLTNFVLAALAAAALHLFSGGMASWLIDGLIIFVEINVSFFVFNMIPFPPLDGSRLLYAFAPDWLRDIMDAIENLGFFVFLGFVLIVFQFVSPVIIGWVQAIVNFLL